RRLGSFFFQAEDGIRDFHVTGVQTCALPIWGIGQVIESYWLTPKLVGDRIGLHPVVVIFAVFAGGTLFGFTGMLLALPVAAIGNVLLRYAYERYIHSRLYAGHAPIMLPPEPAAGAEPGGPASDAGDA